MNSIMIFRSLLELISMITLILGFCFEEKLVDWENKIINKLGSYFHKNKTKKMILYLHHASF